MKKNYPSSHGCHLLSYLVLVIFLLFGTNSTFAQQKTHSLKIENGTLEQAFDEIEKQNSYRFMFNQGDINVKQSVSVDIQENSLNDMLGKLFAGRNINYQITGQQIILSTKNEAGRQQGESSLYPTVNSSQNIATGQTQQEQATVYNAHEPVTITGTVIDDARTAMPFVTVFIQRSDGTIARGTSTDHSGKYTITSTNTSSDKLMVTYIGYYPAEALINGRRIIDITMRENTTIVDEIIVTGYQTISSERATGSYGIVNNMALDRKISTNAIEALEGQVAGVSTYKGNVIVRGASTFSSSVGNSPLLVIDGLPTERNLSDINMNDVESLTTLKDAAAASIYGVRAANGVIVITTKKGTKGKTDIQFTADWRWTTNPSLSEYHYATPGQLMDYETALIQKSANGVMLSEGDYLKQYLKGIGEAGNNSTGINYYSPFRYARMQYLNGEITESAYNGMVEKWQNTNYRREYMDLVWRTPLRQSYNLSVSSATERHNTYASLNFTGNQQRIEQNKDRDIKGYIKSTQYINKWLSFDIGVDVQYSNSERVDDQYSDFTTLEPYSSILDENGKRIYRDFVDISSTTFIGGWHINPKVQEQIDGLPQFMSYRFNILDELEDNKTETHNYSLRSFVKFNVQIYKDLKFTTSFDYEFTKNHSETFNSKDSYYIRFLRNRFANKAAVNSIIPAGGRMGMIDRSTDYWVTRNQLDYHKVIGDDHEITASAGIELKQIQSHLTNYSTYYGYDPTSLNYTLLNNKDITSNVLKQSYIYNNNTGLPGAVLDGSYNVLNDPNMRSPSLAATTNRYVGLYAVGGYTYKRRYGISGSVRVDQANLFGTDPKYRYRPLWSVGVKWNMAKEDFMSQLSWVDMLDVRFSYGLTGNVDQTTSPYLIASRNQHSIYTEETIPYTSITTAPNPLLRWERTTSYNLGVDFALFGGKLHGKFDYYRKVSDDLLAAIETPITSGFTKQMVNYGAMKNKGFEITLSSPWLRKNGWHLTSTLILSYNKNTVTKAEYKATQGGQLVAGSYYKTGKPLNSIYAFRYGGLTNDGTEEQNGVPIILYADGTTAHHYNDDGTLSLDAKSKFSADDVVYMGTGTPPWHGSFVQNVKYKGWEFTAMLTYYGGHKVRTPSFGFYQVTPSNTLPDWIGKAWTPDNTSSKTPKASVFYSPSVNANNLIGLQEMYQSSDVHVKSGDVVRLRNIALSYTLPQKYAQMVRLQRVKVTAQVNNPWYWSAAGKGIDPEVSGTNWTIPTKASYFLRLDITF